MDLSISGISAMQTAQLMASLDTKMTKVGLDNMKAEGAQIIKMIDAAAPVSSPSPAGTGTKGTYVDSYA